MESLLSKFQLAIRSAALIFRTRNASGKDQIRRLPLYVTAIFYIKNKLRRGLSSLEIILVLMKKITEKKLVTSVMILLSTMMILIATFPPNIAIAQSILVVGADDAKITATDNQGNVYEAIYIQNGSCATGWQFLARKVFPNGFISQQSACVSPPCDSASFPQGLHIIRNNNLNQWELSFVDQGGQEWMFVFSGGGTFIQA